MNQFVIVALITERSAMRYTPAGIPAVDLKLSHESTQIEAGSQRQVKLELRAISLGSTAEVLSLADIGKQAKFKGFLTTSKNGKGSVLHITEFEPIF